MDNLSNSFTQFINSIILRLFSRFIKNDTDKVNLDALNYQNTKSINFTAIFSNKLATLTVTDSTVNISSDGEATSRTELLNSIFNDSWDNFKDIVSIALGTGGCALVPYSINGKIYTDIIPQNRFFIISTQGSQITEAVVLSDTIIKNNITYYRWTYYSLERNTYVIRNKATRDDKPYPLTGVTEWAGIQEEIRIANVDRLLIGFLKSPANNRGKTDNYGVPITYGSESIIKEIEECLNDIQIEFKNKQVFVGMSPELYDEKDELSKRRLFKKFASNSIEKDFWQIFDPPFRDTPYYNRLNNLFRILEQSIGVSRGILTEPTAAVTATAIKRANFDTFAMLCNIRKNIEKMMDDLVYSYNVLANYFNLTPPSEYTISFDWDYSLIEDSQETFKQYTEGVSIGTISKAEHRNYLKPAESLEESQRAVDAIRETEPTLRQLVGVE